MSLIIQSKQTTHHLLVMRLGGRSCVHRYGPQSKNFHQSIQVSKQWFLLDIQWPISIYMLPSAFSHQCRVTYVTGVKTVTPCCYATTKYLCYSFSLHIWVYSPHVLIYPPTLPIMALVTRSLYIPRYSFLAERQRMNLTNLTPIAHSNSITERKYA